jgi:hypothetical protein
MRVGNEVLRKAFWRVLGKLNAIGSGSVFSGTVDFCLAGLRLLHAAYYFAISVIPASLIG